MYQINKTKFNYMYQHHFQVLRSDDGDITAIKLESITGDKADTTICVKFYDNYFMFFSYHNLVLVEIINRVTEYLNLCDGCYEGIATCVDNEPRVHQFSGGSYCSDCYQICLENEFEARNEQETMESLRYA